MKFNRWIIFTVAAILLSTIVRTAHSGTEPIAIGEAAFSLRSYNLTVTGDAAKSLLFRMTGPQAYQGLHLQEAPADKDEYGEAGSGLFSAHAGSTTCYYKKTSDGQPQDLRCVVELKLDK